ncbi:NAD(P)/FAD-dependent oxidoreductase [Paenibacillus albus]|uniref:NAD(P)/FAD-dependent oxidoreductase n=1 Tax=Paenibacillus albus TaxID=2495582 RepID=A0A3S8ZZ18_9BACL|nr:NAD(P)/FAD-dependent oxidoreductase [Paenibacillus albus]AZN38712.1 NAD(P)/FAD-dependent oxidoreductase [Paenibacillus albus]
MVMDCIIIGGGIAGLQAAIQLGRYASHQVLVIDAGDGRSAICRSYRNLLGYPDGVSGMQLREAGMRQLAAYGIDVIRDTIAEATRTADGHFLLRGSGSGDTGIGGATTYTARTLLIATGVMDRFTDYPGLRPCLGLTVYVCPDCDGYEVKDRRTVVLGAGDVGASMALTLRAWTDRLIYIDQAEVHALADAAPEAHASRQHRPQQQLTSARLREQLEAAGIQHIEAGISALSADTTTGGFQGVQLADGTTIEAERAFLAYGGNEVRSQLARQLGATLHENGHVWTDPRSKMTSIPGVWAAGDVAVHAEQVSIAMGEGAQAAIWIHKLLLDPAAAIPTYSPHAP